MKSISEEHVFVGLRPHHEHQAMLWTGAAATAAGTLFFLWNLFGEFLLPKQEGGEVVRLGLPLAYVAAYGLGALVLVFALPRLDRLYRARGEITRPGSIGLRVAAAGALLHVLFAAVYFGTAAVTGDAAEAAFLLFALGFLLLIGGSLTAGVSLAQRRAQRSLGGLLLVAAASAILTIVTTAPVHAVALFTFAAAWVGTGLAAVGVERRSAT